MFHPLLKEKFEYFTRYFENAFIKETGKVPQSIILYGQDNLAQYFLALDIARNLNCQKDKSPSCNCINCGWIRQNQHPAVLTISKNDNKSSEDTTKKVISVKQMQTVNNSLINSSEYFRVFIICDSENRFLTKSQEEHLKDFSQLGFKLPNEVNEAVWYPKPLTREILQSEASNALLKSIEEPPEHVLFIFLTEDKEDLLETIVSRSQCFYIPSFLNEKYDIEIFEELLSDYPFIPKSQVPKIAQSFIAAKDEAGYETDYAIDCLQFYFVSLLRSNLESKELCAKIKKDILNLQKAKKQLNAYVKPQIVLENMFFEIAG